MSGRDLDVATAGAASRSTSAATRPSPSPSRTSYWKPRACKNALRWTRLSCRAFRNNAVRLQLFALTYNLANFLRSLALPREIESWSLTTLREKLVSPCRGHCSPKSCAGSRAAAAVTAAPGMSIARNDR